jgi:hypothetical protein
MNEASHHIMVPRLRAHVTLCGDRDRITKQVAKLVISESWARSACTVPYLQPTLLLGVSNKRSPTCVRTHVGSRVARSIVGYSVLGTDRERRCR